MRIHDEYGRVRLPRVPFVSRGNAEALALSTATLLFSVFALWVIPFVESRSLPLRIAAVLLNALSIATLFVLLRWYLHWCWAHRLLGVWHYVSRPMTSDDAAVPAPSYSVARMNVSPNGHLRYVVHMFDTPEAAMAFARCNAGHESPTGRAHDRGIWFDSDQEQLWILYEVMPFGRASRRVGHLFLDVQQDFRMDGYWISETDKSKATSGTLHMVRSIDFKALVGQYAGLENGEGGIAPLVSRDAEPAARPG